jgi:2-keto-4-pentenoate hydratase/2-oxohepta-3-ene-1,7-dioic acid hydratase in catechol pathway
VFGYTCVNGDARPAEADVQFTRGKGFDTFCPMGPVVGASMRATALETYVNGEQQSARTSEMIAGSML